MDLRAQCGSEVDQFETKNKLNPLWSQCLRTYSVRLPSAPLGLELHLVVVVNLVSDEFQLQKSGNKSRHPLTGPRKVSIASSCYGGRSRKYLALNSDSLEPTRGTL